VNIKNLQGTSKPIFIDETEIKSALKHMEEDPALKTPPSYARDNQHSIHLMTFREKHSAYLKDHPKVNPEHYLSNLRAMIKIRP
jgi:hypothetical protein